MMGTALNRLQLAVFKAREAQQLADAARARGNTAAAARLNKNADDWRQTAIREQARMEDLVTRQHPEIEAMRNKFYDEDPGGEDDRREAIRVALNWVLNPKLPDTDIAGYLVQIGSASGPE
jgi:hypothetical protein